MEHTGASKQKSPADRRGGKRSGVMEFAYRELLSRRVLAFSLITLVFVVLTFTIIGPLGSYRSLSLLQRLVYLIVCSVFAWPVCYSLVVVTCYVMRDRAPREIALAVALVTLIASVPCTTVVYAYYVLFHAEHTLHGGFPAMFATMASVCVSGCLLLFYVVWQNLQRSEASAPANEDDRDGRRAVGDGAAASDSQHDDPGVRSDAGGARDRHPHRPFFQRLPIELGRDLIYLKTADHYVDVYTSRGSKRVLARFADAVVELGDLGMQVHRSYWVAHGHMGELATRGKSVRLRLAGGHEVPVSRTYLGAVRAALRATGVTQEPATPVVDASHPAG